MSIKQSMICLLYQGVSLERMKYTTIVFGTHRSYCILLGPEDFCSHALDAWFLHLEPLSWPNSGSYIYFLCKSIVCNQYKSAVFCGILLTFTSSPWSDHLPAIYLILSLSVKGFENVIMSASPKFLLFFKPNIIVMFRKERY